MEADKVYYQVVLVNTKKPKRFETFEEATTYFYNLDLIYRDNRDRIDKISYYADDDYYVTELA